MTEVKKQQLVNSCKTPNFAWIGINISHEVYFDDQNADVSTFRLLKYDDVVTFLTFKSRNAKLV